MAATMKAKPTSLDFGQIEMFINFSDAGFAYPKLSFEQAAKKLGVDFNKVANGKALEKECRGLFGRERHSGRA
jgi:hypothetical protein